MVSQTKPTKEEAIKTLKKLGLVDDKGNLTELGKRIQYAMTIPNKYNNYGRTKGQEDCND